MLLASRPDQEQGLKEGDKIAAGPSEPRIEPDDPPEGCARDEEPEKKSGQPAQDTVKPRPSGDEPVEVARVVAKKLIEKQPPPKPVVEHKTLPKLSDYEPGEGMTLLKLPEAGRWSLALIGL